jgi:hypothetical protein
VTEDQVAKVIVCGPDPERHVRIREFEAAGYDHVYLHRVRPDQADFIDWASRETPPSMGAEASEAALV